MTDIEAGADALLQALWAQDEAPSRDAAFRLAIADRLARRRFRLDLITYGSMAAGMGAAAWAVAPLLAPVGELAKGGIAAAALAAAAVGLSLLWPLSATMSRA